MGTKYCLDSNTIIYYLNDKLSEKGKSFVSELVLETARMSVITEIEVLRFNTTSEETEKIEAFIEIAHKIMIDREIIDKTTQICRKSKIKLPDAIIAATCLVYNMTLITRNTGDFDKIEDLKLINPFDL